MGTERLRIAVAFLAVGMLGVAAGGTGVLLPEQMAEFGVDKATIGLMFFAFSGGYVVVASANGLLLHRFGIRRHLLLGTAATLVATAVLVLPSGFLALLVLQLLLGLGMGMLDAGFNSYLSTLPRGPALLNYFHAFFGVGALIGPLLAAAIVAAGWSWRVFFAVYAVVMVGQLLGLTGYPAAARSAGELRGHRVTGALRRPIVLMLAAFLAFYVGVEASVGNWSFSYLTEARGQAVVAAGWSVSGYWFGLTVGRFTLNATAERLGLSLATLSGVCIGGVGACALAVWLLPTVGASVVALAVMGFFLGPLFPTTIAAVPRLVPADLVATAVGVLVATSIVGGGGVPWLVGLSAQRIGLWTLLPAAALCALGMGLLWWRISRRLAQRVPV
jgi:fucose permease